MTSHSDEQRENFQPQEAVYEKLFKELHSNPELSGQESATADRIAQHLESFKIFKIHKNVGGHGIVAIFDNGPGKKVLLRADMDALPILEQTKLPYRSTAMQHDQNGVLQPVMHACGHDMHMVCLLAAAEQLTSRECRSSWSGTLILVFQPAEESSKGAQAMVDDGLYTRFGVPIPDIVLAQHVTPLRSGQVAVRRGLILGAADSFKVTIFGRGGHASAPNVTIDPIVIAASTIMRLQTIVSREIDPKNEMAVVTVGSIHAGQTENVIPAEAVILINVRTRDEKTREKVLASIRRIIKGEAEAGGAIQTPIIEQISRFPLTINDEPATQKLITSFEGRFGEDFSSDFPEGSASEDFSNLATAVNRPSVFWVIGAIDQKFWDDAKKNGTYIPANHTPLFTPAIQPTLRIGTIAMYAAALEFMKE